MQLAFRKGPTEDPKWYERVTTAIIKGRLVTKYPHGGVIIRGNLYHATAKGGLIVEPFTPTQNWLLLDCGNERDDEIIAQFYARLKASGGKVRYDWFSLLAFSPLNAVSSLFGNDIRYSNWLYCYEWMFEVLQNEPTTERITAETILVLYAQKFGKYAK